jgi:hypothetical protein
MINFLSELVEKCDYHGPKVITMDSSGVNVAYSVRNWAIKKKIRLFYHVVHDPNMIPVEKCFSQVKES